MEGHTQLLQHVERSLTVVHAGTFLQIQLPLTCVTSTPPTPVLLQLYSLAQLLVSSMLPALSHQVAGQLAPVAVAAARSWAGSSLFRRSFAAGARSCWCCWVHLCCSSCFCMHAPVVRSATASAAAYLLPRTCMGGACSSGWCSLTLKQLLLCCHPSHSAPCTEAAGPTIQEVKTAQDYDAIMKHLTGTAAHFAGQPSMPYCGCRNSALNGGEQHCQPLTLLDTKQQVHLKWSSGNCMLLLPELDHIAFVCQLHSLNICNAALLCFCRDWLLWHNRLHSQVVWTL